MSIILESKGTHFDPDMVDAFMEIAEEFKEIAKQYEDTDHDLAKHAKQ